MRFCSMAWRERLRDVFLADDVAETLRAIFSGYDLIRHLIYDLDCVRAFAIVNR